MPRKPLSDSDVVAPLPTEPEDEAGGEETGGGPSTRTIAFGGKSFEVSADIASAWEAREETYRRGISGQGSELGQLRQEIADLRARVAPPTPPEPEAGEFDYAKYEQLSLESPTEAVKYQHDYLAKRDERLRREYRADQLGRELRANWKARLDGFYTDNPDLARDEDLVDLTYQTLARTDPEVASLVKQGNFDAVFEKVADATRRRILDYAGRRGELRPVSRGGRMAVTEGGGLRGGGRSAPAEEDEGPKSVSDAIRARQARHQGSHKRIGTRGTDHRPKPGTE